MSGGYETLVKAIMVVPCGEPIFCERATTVEITDEAAGLYVVVSQMGATGSEQRVSIDQTEWESIKAAIDRMIDVCIVRNRAEAQREGGGNHGE